MNDIYKSIGEKVQEIRKKRGLTQMQLAEACNCHQSVIAMIEKCKRNPSIATIATVLEVLQLKIEISEK